MNNQQTNQQSPNQPQNPRLTQVQAILIAAATTIFLTILSEIVRLLIGQAADAAASVSHGAAGGIAYYLTIHK